MQRNVLGDRHADIQNTNFSIALCMYAKQQLDNAENMFRDVKKKRKEVLGDTHEDALKTKYWIAMCLHDKQDLIVLKKYLEMWKKSD